MQNYLKKINNCTISGHDIMQKPILYVTKMPAYNTNY